MKLAWQAVLDAQFPFCRKGVATEGRRGRVGNQHSKRCATQNIICDRLPIIPWSFFAVAKKSTPSKGRRIPIKHWRQIPLPLVQGICPQCLI